MNCKNAFFKIFSDNTGVYLKFFPKEYGGEDLDADEVISYLEKIGFYGQNLNVVIIKSLKNLNNEKIIKLSANSTFVVDEMIKIIYSEDNMYAFARIYPPSNNGKMLDLSEIIEIIKHSGIKYGIDLKVIKEFLKNKRYCTNFLIARGKPVVMPKETRIAYKFDLNKSNKPMQNEDGSVDFHKLDILNHVSEGDILAVLMEGSDGIDGIDVNGKIIKAAKYKRRTLKYGSNVLLSEDKTYLIAKKSGDVVLENDKVIVRDTFVIKGDVDNSTGDIDYDGNVFVKGNVTTGFKVVATGNVEVSGVVEGAIIEAGGDVVLKCGIQGMNRGYIKAGGSIFSKFLESCNVHADNSIHSGAILHSNIISRNQIFVNSKTGMIVGGTVRSKVLVEAKIIGSPMGTSTIIEVGTDPDIMDRLRFIEKQILQKEDELSIIDKEIESINLKLKQNKGNISELNVYKDIAFSQKFILDTDIEDLQEKYFELRAEINRLQTGTVAVNKIIYPGTKLIISNTSMIIHDEMYRCKFIKENLEIVSV